MAESFGGVPLNYAQLMNSAGSIRQAAADQALSQAAEAAPDVAE